MCLKDKDFSISYKNSEKDSLYTKVSYIPNMICGPYPTNFYISNPFELESPINRT